MNFLEEIPEQVFRNILLRMSYEDQLNFKELSKQAKQIMESSRFHQDRIKFKLTNKYVVWICTTELSILNPASLRYLLTTRLPSGFRASLWTKITCVNHKIVLLNIQYNENHTKKILIYDLSSNTWKQGAECPHLTSDFNFACCASREGSIYIAGGYGNMQNLCEAVVYKVDEDKWEILPTWDGRIGFPRGVFYGWNVLCN